MGCVSSIYAVAVFFSGAILARRGDPTPARCRALRTFHFIILNSCFVDELTALLVPDSPDPAKLFAFGGVRILRRFRPM